MRLGETRLVRMTEVLDQNDKVIRYTHPLDCTIEEWWNGGLPVWWDEPEKQPPPEPTEPYVRDESLPPAYSPVVVEYHPEEKITDAERARLVNDAKRRAEETK